VQMMALPDLPEFGRDQLLGFERDLMGLYITDHPLQAHTATFAKRNCTKIAELAELSDRHEVLLGGIITAMKPFTSKKSGEPMAFFTLEDMTATMRVTIFPSNFAQWGDAIAKDAIVMVKGRTSYRDRMRDDDDDEGERTVELLADEVYTVSGGARKADTAGRKIIIRLDEGKRNNLRFVRETIEQYRGNGGAQEVYLHVPVGEELKVVRTELFAEFTDPFRVAIEKLLGRQAVWQE